MLLGKVVKQMYVTIPFKQPVLEVMRRRLRLPQSLTQHLSFRGPFTIAVDELHEFRLQHWGFYVETALFWGGLKGGYEATSLEVWRRFASHARVIADVGANTGIYTLLARCVNAGATIIAMEPVERVFRRLCRNLQLNDFDVIATQAAASDVTGRAPIFDPVADHELTASLSPSMPQKCLCVSRYQVPTTRLDDFFCDRGLNGVDLIKIDVEQFEPQVVRGMGRFLSDGPTLLIEVLNSRLANELTDLTLGRGYNIFQIIEGRGLLPRERIDVTGTQDRNYLLAGASALKQANLTDLFIDGACTSP